LLEIGIGQIRDAVGRLPARAIGHERMDRPA
jgi:hypothetical protein